MMRISWLFLISVLAVLQACSPSNKKKRSQQPSVANPLTRMVGDWTVSTQVHLDDGEDPTFKGTDTCRWIGSSQTLACTYRAHDGYMSGLNVRSWNPSTDEVSGYWMASDNPNGPLQFTGTYDAKTGTLDELEEGKDKDGKPLKLRMVRTFKTDKKSVIQYTQYAPDGTQSRPFTSTLKKTSK